MAHFAKVENGIVTQVIVANQNIIDSGAVGDPKLWVQTSYNTYGGIHYDPITKEPDNGIALRGNYAGVGYIYDSVNDVFYPQRPIDTKQVVCDSWTISAPTWTWTPPTPRPTDENRYLWDEATKTWELFLNFES